ncbi:hypothetical protein [Rhodococcus sp. MEB041]|uniref:hypothetical protein n=1 Tax=Rhodococcus sp. MEB041 TaxID=3040323 RepID=UPI0025503D9C|nr:hypothetical protein [Rhodococcus sp. MEB041]
MPLIQVIQIAIVAVAALVGLPAAFKAYSERSRLETRAKVALELSDKVDRGVAGWAQLRRNSDDAVLRLAFLLEYPRTIRRRVPTFSFATVMVAASLAMLLLLRDGRSWLVWGLIALEFGAGFISHFSFRNTMAADRLIFALFSELRAPTGLHYPKAKLISKQWVPGVGDVFDIAASIRDRSADIACDTKFMTTVEACNVARIDAEETIRDLVRRIRRLRVKNFYKGRIVIPLRQIRVWYVLAVHYVKREVNYRRAVRLVKKNRSNATPHLQAAMDAKLTTLKLLARGDPTSVRAVMEAAERESTNISDKEH